MSKTATKYPRRIWTPEEEEELLESYGTVSMVALEKKFHRSIAAIRLKHAQLTGTADVNLASGTLTASEIATAVGVSHKTVVNWIHHFQLPATQRYKQHGSSQRARYSISSVSFWRWASKNKERIPFQLLERHIILPEPPWVEKEVQQSLKEKPFKLNVDWSIQEDETAYFWWMSGMNYRDIAKRLNRPEKGTQRRLTYIKKLKTQNHAKSI